MALNLHHLRVFARVAEEGGFTRAARAMRLSQPAVSKAVRELERQTGVPLFERAGRATRLTGPGEALFARARELFAVERSAEEELRALRGLSGGVLRVGASTTVATYLLFPYLARFREANPGVELRVSSANTRAIARALLERRLDVALVEGPVRHARIEVVPWREDELVLITPPTHRLAAKRSIELRALSGEPLIVREPGSGTRRVAERALAAHDVSPRVTLQLGSTEAIKQAVAAGLGVAFVSRFAVEEQVKLGRIAAVRVREAALRRMLTELRLAGRAEGPGAVAFREMLSRA
ncbi:MAG TPA: LysR substrate-binding domain-containing protein [Gemmatimonadaceae bacterium]|nr:LysR substrate-binding domain-containing protein [Gemmatimonadaceae bacterium]